MRYFDVLAHFFGQIVPVLHCEPEGGLWSKGYDTSQKHSCKYKEHQLMSHQYH
jgi:hypothetical protein